VATEILALLGLRSFRAAALLLSGMLAYDVFAVFGSSHGAEDGACSQRSEARVMLTQC
jgi:hypothetical protein